MVKIIPLGGLGEIGMNMMVVVCGESAVIIDAGIMFPEDHMLGVDCVIPEMAFIRDIRENISAIFLTHGHEDHVGALPFLLREVDAPIYATPFTLGLISLKLREHELRKPPKLRQIHPGDEVAAGDFRVEFIRVGHSIVDGVALALHTPLGTIIHTGDFKISYASDPNLMTDVRRLAQCGEEGVLALLSDSTNVEKEGFTATEETIAQNLRNIIAESPGRVIVALFATAILRIQQMIAIALEQGYKVVFNGRSVEASVQVARDLGYIQMPDDLEIGIGDLEEFPNKRTMIITTGSQGEPMSALARMSSGIHKQIRIKKGDTVILSSKFIPGNEKAIAKIINNLYRRGANVIYEKISKIHVSGHAFREELKMMIQLTRPRYFIPIHGEYRHLVLHTRLAKAVGVPEENILLAENGNVVTFDAEGARIAETVPTGRVMVDGKGVGDVGRSLLKERRTLSEEGFVAVTLAFDEETGVVVYGPEIASRGFVFETETGHLLDDAICVILEIVEEITPDIDDRLERIRQRIKSDLRKYFDFTIRRKPLILPFILEV